jgi:hypothetical protein
MYSTDSFAQQPPHIGGQPIRRLKIIGDTRRVFGSYIFPRNSNGTLVIGAKYCVTIFTIDSLLFILSPQRIPTS